MTKKNNSAEAIPTKLENKIRKFALANAFSHGGKAQQGSIIGKLISEDPNIKSQLKDLTSLIQKTIKDISKLSKKQQEEELKKTYPEFFEKKEIKEKTLPDLKDAKKGKVIMRFRPSPSGPLHIGHAYTMGLGSEFCRKYNGELYIIIDDTNPANIYLPAYDLIKEDAQWVSKNNIKKVSAASDNIETHYAYAKKLVELGHAYVCTCDSEDFRKLLLKGKPCECRNSSPTFQLKRWNNMFDKKKFKQGDAVLRIKTDLKHKNPAMRDWPAARIVDEPHPKQGEKYRVWPLMNFAVAIDDHEQKVTHAVRAKEHRDNELRQKYIYDYFGWDRVTNLYVGRINFLGLPVSCSKTKLAISEGKYTGWDDPRIPFLRALRKRGYQPETFIRYALEVGVSENDKTVKGDDFFKTIDTFNREILDPISDRYFFVGQPIYLKIEDTIKKDKIKISLHPDNKNRSRGIEFDNEFFISRKDAELLKTNSIVRLKDLFKIKIVSTKGTEKMPAIITAKLCEDQKLDSKVQKIEWVPKNSNVDVEVHMPDGNVILGHAEKATEKLKVGDIIQFQRFGFCRLDKKEKNKLIFYYAHK